jgi:tRNA threonylcarbamoyladenosine biosynthesis protein TsaE
VSEQLKLPSPEATDLLGRDLARAVLAEAPETLCIYLRGDLGAGKTSLARAFLRGCGHAGRVPSPTYTLVEPYDSAGYKFFHMDLYRLQDPGELEYLGLAEMCSPGSILLVEWPERGAGSLLPGDLELELKVDSAGRDCRMVANSTTGAAILQSMLAAKS